MAIAVIQFGVTLPVASCIGLALAAALGLLLGLPAVRLSGDYLAIVTIAASEIIRYLTINMQEVTGGSIGSLGMGALMTFLLIVSNGIYCLLKYRIYLVLQAGLQ